MGFPSVYFGGITVDEVKRRDLEVNETNEKKVREELRRTEGLEVMAQRIIPQIEELFKKGQAVVIADGLYSWSEYKILKERFASNMILIAIAAPRHLRHNRLAHRPTRPFTEAEVTAREYAEIENLEKGGPIANADYTIVNDSDPYTLLNNLENLLKDLEILE